MRILFLLLILAGYVGSVLAQETSLEVCEQSLNRALALKNRDSLAAAYCRVGEFYAYRNADSARYFFEKGLEYVRKSDSDLYCTLLINEADTYSSNGDIDEAIKRFQFALQKVERYQEKVDLKTSILGSLGVMYRRKAMPDSALVCYTKALELLESLDEPDEKLYLLTNVAILYANTQRMEEAGNYIEKAMKEVERCQDLNMVMYAGSTAGVIFSHLKKSDQAFVCLRQVIQKGRKEQKPRFVLKGINYLLGHFQRMNLRDSIGAYLEEADRLAATLPEANTEVQGFRETQYQILTYLNRYRESLAVQRNLLHNRVENAQVSWAKLYYSMAKNYVALKEYAQAVDCYELALVQTDSLKQAQMDQQLSEWSVKYQTKEKEMEIVRLQQERSEQKARALQWSILAVVLILVLVFVIIYGTIRRKQLKKIEELKLAKRYIEGLERERSRLAKDLHDGVCNDLLGVGMQLSFLPPDEASKQEVLQLLERIRKDVRSISHELMPPQFQQLTLLQTVESYLDRLPCVGAVNVALHADEQSDWQVLSENVSYDVYRILQEWLSNIWKYAKASRVDVWLSLDAEHLLLRVVNDGLSFDPQQCMGNGIGLTTIQERVKSLGGSLSMTVQDGSQIFELSVPVLGAKPSK